MTWKSMHEYPDKGRRVNGKWRDEPGPIVDLKMPDGRIVERAQWRGEKIANGGEGWAFWFANDPHGIGYYEPQFFRIHDAQRNGLAMRAIKHPSWFWYGRYEGRHFGYWPPHGFWAGLLYRQRGRR